jgi:hypothetical protein
MKQREIEYQILQTANPTGWKWTVHMDQRRTKTGESSSRGSAIFSAIRAIDRALGAPPKIDDDPIKSGAVGWFSGELGQNPVTHEVRKGRLIPKPAK